MTKGTFVRAFLIFLCILTVGCERIGYIVTISASHVKYEDLKQIEGILEYKGFKTIIMERKEDKPGSRDKIYTLLEKKLSDKNYYVVDIDLNYVKDLSNNTAYNLRIDVSNVYKGMTVTALKDEIDKIGDLVFHELVGKLGEKNVSIERKEIHRQFMLF